MSNAKILVQNSGIGLFQRTTVVDNVTTVAMVPTGNTGELPCSLSPRSVFLHMALHHYVP